MMTPRPLEINASRRIVRLRGAACGGVITGTDKIRSGYGNGDCVILDFARRVFAVADGSERHPTASRDLLNRLRSSLSRSGAPGTLGEWIDMLNDEVYSGQKYQHKTTFSCAAIAGEGDERTIFISHGGDSAVTLMDAARGKMVFQTGRDMNFAGRSRLIADCTEHRMTDRGVRVVVSTDGFNDLLRYCKRHSLFPRPSRVLADVPADRICEEMHDVLDAHSGKIEYDDIGLIVFDPFALRGGAGDKTIVIGGTKPHEEARFIREYASGPRDRWAAEGEWDGCADLFAGAGIQVQAP